MSKHGDYWFHSEQNNYTTTADVYYCNHVFYRPHVYWNDHDADIYYYYHCVFRCRMLC